MRSPLRRFVLVSTSLLALAACGDDANASPPIPAPIAIPAIPAMPAIAAPSAPAAVVAPATAGALATAPLFTASTHALVIGLLDFADPSLTDFSAEDRRDAVVASTLVARGVPASQVTTMYDAQATHATILAAVARVADETPVGGTLVFYYAGHGTRTSSGDIAYIAYDTGSGSADQTGVTVEQLYATLAPRVVGKRVLFLADCCHSGGLGGLASRLSGIGATAISVTSADASNTSTGNWTYSQILLEALRGEPCLDANGDGSIGIAELESSVRDAMRYREGQRSGAFLGPVAPTLAIGERAGAPRTGSRAGRFFRSGGEVVRVESDDGTTAVVRAFDYASTRDSRVAVSALRPIESTRYAVGAQLSVEWGGRVWPAVVTATDGDFAYITYPGWPSYWDEWILSDRVRGTTGTH